MQTYMERGKKSIKPCHAARKEKRLQTCFFLATGFISISPRRLAPNLPAGTFRKQTLQEAQPPPDQDAARISSHLLSYY